MQEIIFLKVFKLKFIFLLFSTLQMWKIATDIRFLSNIIFPYILYCTHNLLQSFGVHIRKIHEIESVREQRTLDVVCQKTFYHSGGK